MIKYASIIDDSIKLQHTRSPSGLRPLQERTGASFSATGHPQDPQGARRIMVAPPRGSLWNLKKDSLWWLLTLDILTFKMRTPCRCGFGPRFRTENAWKLSDKKIAGVPSPPFHISNIALAVLAGPASCWKIWKGEASYPIVDHTANTGLRLIRTAGWHPYQSASPRRWCRWLRTWSF